MIEHQPPRGSLARHASRTRRTGTVIGMVAGLRPHPLFIYNTQVLLDVEVVALGGGISERSAFVASVAREVDALFDASILALPRPKVLAARYGNDANLVGALYHHLHSTTD
jgi:predicted NBD/HSP70 family sugar kinase